MSDHLTNVYRAHAYAAAERGREDAHTYGEHLRRGTINENVQRRMRLTARATGIVDQDRALTGRVTLLCEQQENQ